MTILALDVGSSSVRALLFENASDGMRLIPDAIAQHHYSFDTDDTGKSTVDAAYLRGLVEDCIDAILQHPRAAEIQGVGMDTFVGNLVAVDGQNEALTPVMTYADTRGTEHVNHNTKSLNHAAFHQATGTIFHTAYWPAKIPQFDYPHELEPFILKFQDFATYCYREWFGTSAMSYSVASWSGLLNRATTDWHEDWLTHLNLPKMMLPQLADCNTAQQGLITDYKRRWPQLANVPFYLAIGDGAAAQIGSGAIAENTATLTVGTTAAMRVTDTRKLPYVPAGLWSYRIDKAHHLLGGALSEGGSIFAWARQTLNLTASDIENELAQRMPGTHRLTVLPLLAGERSPGWWSEATGAIQGLRLSTTPIDICHALLESVALRLALIAQQLDLNANTKIMASGGSLRHSQAWAQIIADALEHPLYLLDEPEISALGTAHLVHCALQGKPLSGASPHITQIIEPRPEFSARYAELSEQQVHFYNTLRND